MLQQHPGLKKYKYCKTWPLKKVLSNFATPWFQKEKTLQAILSNEAIQVQKVSSNLGHRKLLEGKK
jgi:hypothetical protein